ncbi:hypothetical protein [Delftia sp. CH05]|uniref:hypothetical protein n=1 Tax=Delftia sp. CH05 TaxID=2692194 RepID=UPI00135DB5B7|nr:hypothetical protein [Delftia sp. CH05]MXN29193.1 hypothetical protein [Delftia sp. CH05]
MTTTQDTLAKRLMDAARRDSLTQEDRVAIGAAIARITAGAAPAAVAPEHPPMPETWAVVASIEGQDVVCISSNALCGKGELTESEEQAVIGMARHLLAFAGYGLSPCDFDPDAEPDVVVGLASREDDRARMEAERNDSLDRYRLIAEVPCTEANAYKDGFAAGWGRRGEAAAAAQEAAQPAQSAG